MNLWPWLNTNAGALQSLFALAGIILTVVTIWVLIATWRAIKVQADAARELTKAAVEQTTAAKDAAESARRQAELLTNQLELSTAPLIVVEPDDRPMGSAQKLVNRGPGPAFQVCYWPGGLELMRPGTSRYDFRIDPSTLAPGAFVYVMIPEKSEWRVWTVQYKGIDNQERWTKFYRDENRGQEHIIRIGTETAHLM